jgi:hypothetical protein
MTCFFLGAGVILIARLILCDAPSVQAAPEAATHLRVAAATEGFQRGEPRGARIRRHFEWPRTKTARRPESIPAITGGLPGGG